MDLDLVISKTLSKEVSQRYRTAEQFSSVLLLIKKRISSPIGDEPKVIRCLPNNPASASHRSLL